MAKLLGIGHEDLVFIYIKQGALRDTNYSFMNRILKVLFITQTIWLGGMISVYRTETVSLTQVGIQRVILDFNSISHKTPDVASCRSTNKIPL